MYDDDRESREAYVRKYYSIDIWQLERQENRTKLCFRDWQTEKVRDCADLTEKELQQKLYPKVGA